METRGSRHDWNEYEDEESESVEDWLIRLFYMLPATK